MNRSSDLTANPTLTLEPLLPQVHSYQKRGDEASRAHGGAVQAEGWGECQGDRESEPGEGQQSGGQPAGELGLLNLKYGAEVQIQVVQGSGALSTFPFLAELLVISSSACWFLVTRTTKNPTQSGFRPTPYHTPAAALQTVKQK